MTNQNITPPRHIHHPAIYTPHHHSTRHDNNHHCHYLGANDLLLATWHAHVLTKHKKKHTHPKKISTTIITQQTVLGAGGVGKSSLTGCVSGGTFNENYDPTIEDLYTMTFTIDGVDRTVDILDTAGQDEFASMLDQWMREGDGFLLVYSIASQDSFNHVKTLIEKITRTKGPQASKVPIVIVGNKCDLPDDQREVQEDTGKNFAQTYNFPFFEASAVTQANASSCFNALVKAMFNTDNTQKNAPKKGGKGKCTIL